MLALSIKMLEDIASEKEQEIQDEQGESES